MSFKRVLGTLGFRGLQPEDVGPRIKRPLGSAHLEAGLGFRV